MAASLPNLQGIEMVMLAKNSRIEWIDVAKGGCIILVVLWHTVIFSFAPSETNTPGYQAWFKLGMALQPLRMPLFFMLSGFLAYSSVYSRTWRDTFQPRIATLLWLYVLWMTFNWGVHVILATYFNSAAVPKVSELPMSMSTFLFDLVTANTTIWYLYALAIFFTVCKLFKNHSVKVVIILSILSICSRLISDDWNIISLLSNAVFFAIGCFGRNLLARHFAVFNPIRFAATTIASTATLYVAWKYELLSAPGMRFALAITLIIATMDTLAWVTHRLNLSAVAWIGQRSLPIYVIHMSVVVIFAQFTIPADLEGASLQAFTIVGPILLTTANIVFCLFLYSILKRLRGVGLFSLPLRLNRTAAP